MKKPISANPNGYRQAFSATAKVDTIDERGYYIYEGGINVGVNYLYQDGIIREGVGYDTTCINPPAFWPTEESANAFLTEWRADLISEGAGG